MALSDPQSVTINAVAVSLPRTAESPFGEYLFADGTKSMQIKHARGNRLVSTVSLRVAKIAADPYTPTVNKPVYATISITFNRPIQGFTNVELLDFFKALEANLVATTYQNTSKILGLEK